MALEQRASTLNLCRSGAFDRPKQPRHPDLKLGEIWQAYLNRPLGPGMNN